MEDLPWQKEPRPPAYQLFLVNFLMIFFDKLNFNSQGAKLTHLESLPLVLILVLVCIVTSVVSQVKYKVQC